MIGALSLALSLAPLPYGRSAIELDIGGVPIQAYVYKPSTYRAERMILVLHGTLRNADEYRDHAESMGDRFGALIVAPKFDSERFPSRRYQFGGILDADRKPVPPEQWTYAFLPKIAAKLQAREASPLRYWIIGHSAGGQFIVRMAAFQDTGAERLVAANAGSHLFPTFDLPFGYGFGGLPPELATEDRLRRYLAAPLTLYQGTGDDHPDEYFDQSPNAMKQGPGRYQRGLACFAAARELARTKGWRFGWRLVEAKGIAHDHEKMFNHPNCGWALFGTRNAELGIGF